MANYPDTFGSLSQLGETKFSVKEISTETNVAQLVEISKAVLLGFARLEQAAISEVQTHQKSLLHERERLQGIRDARNTFYTEFTIQTRASKAE